ncbi:MAG TPA: zinc finger protein, partial [Longimicrobium sp.]|nr:zinc finger protein [Longimicrobium sp.]
MAIREGRWDCPSCGSKAVYGRHVDCPGCGRPRPAGIRFYLTEDAPAIVDAAQLAEARAGADWICEHCQASNRATIQTCAGCGAARGTSPTQPVQDFGMGAVPRTGASTETSASAPAAALGTIPAQPVYAAGTGATTGTGTPTAAPAGGLAAARGSRWILPAVAAVFVGLCVLIGWAASTEASRGPDPLYSYVPTPPVPAVVEGKRWDRRIEARLLSALIPGQGYALPEGARVLTTQQQRTGDRRVVDHYVTSTRQVERTVSVPDGYETVTEEVEETVETGTRTYTCGQRDLGNGYFEDQECSEPEYETRTRTVSRRQPRYREETRMETVTDRTPVYRTVPVYRTWYTWNQPVWRDTVYLASGDTTQPEWPQVEP